MDNKQALQKLWAAQAGDAAARDDVILHVIRTYGDRLARFYLKYPAFSREDIEQEFARGVCEAVDKADERGDPIYFIGQWGIWRVQSMVRAARFVEHGALAGGVMHDSLELKEAEVARLSAQTGGDEIVESLSDGLSAMQRVAALLSVLEGRPKLQQLVRLALDDLAEQEEAGLGARLAQGMELSPQRISQLMAELREELEAADWRAAAQRLHSR